MTEPGEPIDIGPDESAENRYPVAETLDDAPVVVPKAPPTVRGAMIVGARVVAGTIGIGAAVATLAAAIFVPFPSAVGTPPSLEVTPVAAVQQRMCAGPLLRLGDDSGQGANTPSALGLPQITSAASEGRVVESPLASTEEVAGIAPEVLALAPGSGEQAPLLAGAQSQTIDSGDFVGAAAAGCVEARNDTWLVGGATTTGRTSILTIANPGETTATVDVTVYSTDGTVDAPGSSGIVIAPHSERVFSLAGFAPDLPSPVVRVQSSGGQVVATLQQTTVRTLAAGGIDFVTASVAPSTTAVIPGLLMVDEEVLEHAMRGHDYLDLNPVLRVLVPGDLQGHALLTMTPQAVEGERAAKATEVSVTLDAGQVTELPIGGFDPGIYTMTITADVPFVAGARAATVSEGLDAEAVVEATNDVNDFVWLPSAGVLHDRALVAVAPGEGATLNLVNPGTSESVVRITSPDDGTTRVTVRAGGAVTMPVSADTSYLLSDFDSLHVYVGYLGNGTITGYPVSPPAPASTPIRVFP